MKFTLSRIRELCVHYTDRALFKYYRGKLASKGRGTSMSDDNAYPAVCYMASRNEYAFRKFRRNSTYNDILEHVSGQQGQEYLPSGGGGTGGKGQLPSPGVGRYLYFGNFTFRPLPGQTR